MTETGLQSLPSLGSWYQVTDNISDLQYGSAFYQHREHSPNKVNDLLYVDRIHCRRIFFSIMLCSFSVMKLKAIYHYR